MAQDRSQDRKIIAGNWKMNGNAEAAVQFIDELMQIEELPDNADVVICPPLTFLTLMADAFDETDIAIGGQDCSAYGTGAYTGDVSAEMLFEAGADFVIVGHSERRHGQKYGHLEDDALIRSKAEAAIKAGLTPIVCVGETKEQREGGHAEVVVSAQLAHSLPDGDCIIAYEPIWAIGTGLTATAGDIEKMHAFIRQQAGDRPILYGGSVKPDNAEEIMATRNVDGVLVGGASLKAEDFLAIIRAAG